MILVPSCLLSWIPHPLHLLLLHLLLCPDEDEEKHEDKKEHKEECEDKEECEEECEDGGTWGEMWGGGWIQLTGGGGGTPAPEMQTLGPDSGPKTGDKCDPTSWAPGESNSPKKSHWDVNILSKKALILMKPQSYHMSKD